MKIINVILPILGCLLVLFSCSTVKGIKNSAVFNDDIANNSEELAFLLCQLYGEDQIIREANGTKEGVIVMKEIDSINFLKAIKLIESYGFPNRKLLGHYYEDYECVSLSIPAIMLHNPSKVVEKETYNLLLSEVRKGNLSPELFALFLDKYYVYYHGYSLYNTQFKRATIKNKERVNKARLEIGLEILPDSAFSVQ
ncbi:hypothetical protein ACTML9_08000 [Porphyromonas levii]|uniref:hypothetical protein n=1 Tax=Porphyromonas levii TaxID=28114 RepID=UPI003F9F1ABF